MLRWAEHITGMWSEAVRNKPCLKGVKDSNVIGLLAQNLMVRTVW